MNPLLIICFLYMYTNQHLNVSWNNSMSLHFCTTSGVKQGGMLSGFGCTMGYKYYADGYADDSSPVAPSIYALNKMCGMCLEFEYEYDLQFNSSKCKLINYKIR